MRLLNPELDIDAVRRAFARDRFVVVPDFLDTATARLLHGTLRGPVPWEFWSRGDRGTAVVAPECWATMTDDARAALVPPPPTSVDRFHFAYERITPDTRSADAGIRTLGGFVDALNGSGYLELMRHLAGDERVNKVDGAFSRYRRGHYLSPHTDANKDQVRLVAHVIGLTPVWEEHWGGTLTLCTPAGTPEAIVPPRFNTLVLFEVPRWHFVSPVQAHASRYSFFGWLVERNLEVGSTDATRVLG